jgi:hypothetical protein
MSENTITTLSEFLEQSGAHYRVFDMGRRVIKLSAKKFTRFEAAEVPYPYPFQRTALFGIIFWHPQFTDRHYVWFLKFPLDEQGLLIQAARDEFLVMVLDRVGEYLLAAADGKYIEGALKDSPYSFNPREDRMAAFNAMATKSLSLRPSSFYEAAYDYFTGQKPFDSWQVLGMQGVADIAVRTDDKALTKALIQTLPQLPPQPFHMLTSFMENAEPANNMVEALQWRLKNELEQNQPDITEVCACLRAVSNTAAQGMVESMVKQTLVSDISRHIEVLAVIAGRCWKVLEKPELCQLFVEKLAVNEAGYEGFSHILADLMFMPGMRELVMAALRNPNRSAELTQQVGTMFGS